jgi:hypothetical protein
MNIFLDDERVPSDVTWLELPKVEWTIVRNFKEFTTLLDSAVENGQEIEFITFDHDLADEHYKVMLEEVRYTAFANDKEGGVNITFDYGKEKTGYECAKYLVEMALANKLKIPPYTVHSLNNIGAERIKAYLENAKKFMEEDGA